MFSLWPILFLIISIATFVYHDIFSIKNYLISFLKEN